MHAQMQWGNHQDQEGPVSPRSLSPVPPSTVLLPYRLPPHSKTMVRFIVLLLFCTEHHAKRKHNKPTTDKPQRAEGGNVRGNDMITQRLRTANRPQSPILAEARGLGHEPTHTTDRVAK